MREAVFQCPKCDTELRVPETDLQKPRVQTICPACQARLDVNALLAYLRGLEAFDEGQEIMIQLNPRKVRSYHYPADRKAMELFKEAYTSLQLAFEGDLVDDQRQLGIEMMASMAEEFSRRLLISKPEGQYWHGVMSELVSQNECEDIKQNLNRPKGESGHFRARWNKRRRQRHLLSVLKKLDKKLTDLENMIEFIELPKARNRTPIPISTKTENKFTARLADEPIDSNNIFLFHKTTHRTFYENTKRNHPGYDDVLLFNEQGEMTEFTIGNLVVEMNGKLFTPPIACGLLAGTFRAHLLENGPVEERVIRMAELKDCTKIFLVNSVRKWQQVDLSIS